MYGLTLHEWRYIYICIYINVCRLFYATQFAICLSDMTMTHILLLLLLYCHLNFSNCNLSQNKDEIVHAIYLYSILQLLSYLLVGWSKT